MTKFILIRHGEPRYDQVLRKESYSLGYDFGKLTINGIEQAKKVASDARLTDADIIVSSPFTRALQTAANIASIKNLEVLVENDLHEWIPDINMTGKINGELAFKSYMSNNSFLYFAFFCIFSGVPTECCITNGILYFFKIFIVLGS